MKVLLTGGSGFIGANLASRLARRGYETVAVGRRVCPVRDVRSVEVEALSADALSAVLSAERFDCVFHLAAAGVHPSDRNLSELFRVNATLPAEVVSAASVAGVSAVVLMGSSAEYAASERVLREEMPLESTKLYGASKAAGGLLALATAASCGTRAALLRAFNVFGAGEASHRLLPSLAAKLVKGNEVELSPGLQIRDFIYVDDACEALIQAAHALLNQSMPTGAYNLATSVGTTVRDFALTVAMRLQADTSLLRFGALPLRPDDLPVVVGDASKLKAATQWQPQHSLDEGVDASLRSLELI